MRKIISFTAVNSVFYLKATNCTPLQKIGKITYLTNTWHFEVYMGLRQNINENINRLDW